MAQKKISAVVMPMTYENWLIMKIPNSLSVGSVSCLDCHAQRCITSQFPCVSLRSASWPGSTPSTLRIQRPEAGGWLITWPMKAFRSVATECGTSCAAWGYERFIRNLALQFLAIQPSDFRAWLISIRSRLSIRSGRLISPTSPCGKASSIWLQLLISFPDIYLAGNYPTALTRNSVWTPWKWRLQEGANLRSSTQIKALNSLPSTLWNVCRRRRSRSAGLAGEGALTTFLSSDCGGRSSMRRCICGLTAMVWRLSLGWPDFSGGIAM